jgi:hypothetical protein
MPRETGGEAVKKAQRNISRNIKADERRRGGERRALQNVEAR